jgi:hypothetical protein
VYSKQIVQVRLAFQQSNSDAVVPLSRRIKLTRKIKCIAECEIPYVHNDSSKNEPNFYVPISKVFEIEDIRFSSVTFRGFLLDEYHSPYVEVLSFVDLLIDANSMFTLSSKEFDDHFVEITGEEDNEKRFEQLCLF